MFEQPQRLIRKLLRAADRLLSLERYNRGIQILTCLQISPVPQCSSGSVVPTLFFADEPEQYGQFAWPFDLHFFGPHCHKPHAVLFNAKLAFTSKIILALLQILVRGSLDSRG